MLTTKHRNPYGKAGPMGAKVAKPRASKVYTTEDVNRFEREKVARERSDEARVRRAERRADTATENERRARVAGRTPPPAPTSREGGAGGSRPSRASSKGKSKSKSKSLLRIPRIHGNPRRILVAEGIGLSLVVTAGKIGRGEPPELMDYVPVWTVFLLLAFAAEAGPKSARLAVAFGGLLTLVIVLRDVAPFTKVLATASGGPTSVPGPTPIHSSAHRRGHPGPRGPRG
jgi:hypothetical protein